MYLSIIILPLLGSIVSGFFGRKVGVTGAQFITSSCVIVTTILALLAFIEVGFNNIPVSITLFKWIDSEWFNIVWGFEFDSLTVAMLIPVLIISSLVHVYSISYMSNDPHNQRFFSYLSLFTFMMIILVTGNNYLLMFVGWEGVGVCSYLLVSFWFTRIAANQSSLSAFLTNRVGDCFLTIGMFAILWSLGNLDYATVFSNAPYIHENVLTIIGICLLIGAMAKSSQVGLHVWLPMAMEGPTPVSALIHAATMVTAGVYLLIRSSPLIEYSSTVLLLCLWLGAITTVFSSLIGLFQQDIKKVIAYSTMSHLARENNLIIFRLQAICVEIYKIINSQITKALDYITYNQINNNFFNSFFVMRQYLFYLSNKIMSVKWEIIVISKQVGISEAIRLILTYSLNLYNILTAFLFTTSYSKYSSIPWQDPSKTKSDNLVYEPFFEWLAGVIDGNGQLNLYKNGNVRLTIVMDIKDKHVIYLIKNRLGGSIHTIANGYALKYKLTHKKGIIYLLCNINGLIRNPARRIQMERLCTKYCIESKNPIPLKYRNGWFSGFLDSDGSIYLDEAKRQVFISITQKNNFLLIPLMYMYGGNIEIDSKADTFKYTIYKKKEVINLIDNYFSIHPLKTKLESRVSLIKQFYLITDSKNNTKTLKEWVSFKEKWDKFKE
jgi:NADH:ubiquinone oxidoreductase subunit 4 (subunit M)